METKVYLILVDLFKKTGYNIKITKIESKIPSISCLATNSALAAVEHKIPDISSLVKKADYDAKISELGKKVTDHYHDKYITTSKFNNLTAKGFVARLAQANLVTNAIFYTKLMGINKRINSNKTKHVLITNELRKTAKM